MAKNWLDFYRLLGGHLVLLSCQKTRKSIIMLAIMSGWDQRLPKVSPPDGHFSPKSIKIVCLSTWRAKIARNVKKGPKRTKKKERRTPVDLIDVIYRTCGRASFTLAAYFAVEPDTLTYFWHTIRALDLNQIRYWRYTDRVHIMNPNYFITLK